MASPWPVRAAPVNIRYATGGGIGPNEMETLIWLDYLKSNVLKNYGKAYTLDMTFTRGSPEAAQLLAAGQVDLAALSSPAFASAIAKDAVPGGISIISDIYQDGHPGFASNTFFVMKDSPIKSIADLKGKKVAINAYGSAVDLVLRVALKKANLDPRRDLQIVEVTFPNIAAAIREGRVDCGVLVIPFLPAEAPRATCAGCSAAATRSGPRQWSSRSRPTSSSASSLRFCARSWRTSCRGSLVLRPGEPRESARTGIRLDQVPKEVLDTYFITPRDYYRDRNGCVPVSAVQKPIDAMVEYKLIDRPVDAAKYMKMQFLPKPCST